MSSESMMKHRKGFSALVCASCLFALTSLPAFGQQIYHLNDLTPPTALAGKLNGTSGAKQVGRGNDLNGNPGHAWLFTGNALTSIDLNPATFSYSQATSISDDGAQQCGVGFGVVGSGMRPLLWSGSSASVVDLGLLSNFSLASCHGVNNGQQVGESQSQNLSNVITSTHATLWSGGTTAAVDLHPGNPLFPFSYAMGVKGGEQVGFESLSGYPTTVDSGWELATHAIRWAGTAASAVDLHPAGFDASRALATNGTQQGGWGYITAAVSSHALLWNGDAAGVIDLHPAGFDSSRVTALNGTIQVGDGFVAARIHLAPCDMHSHGSDERTR